MNEQDERFYLKNQLEHRIYGKEEPLKTMWWIFDTAINTQLHENNKQMLLNLAESWAKGGNEAIFKALSRI